MAINELSEEFKQLREQYFPELDGAWKVEMSDCEGYCDRDRETILVKDKSDTHANRRVVIIHEMAHAVTDDSHGEKWLQRMDRVIQSTSELGDHDLRNALKEHLEWMTGENDYDAKDSEILGEIRSYAVDAPEASFDQVATAVGKTYGLSLNVFLKTYPSARDVFENARKSQQHRNL